MLGTIVNAGAIVAGGLLGLLLKKGFKENYRTIVNQAVSLAIIFVGLSGALAGLLAEGASPVLFIVSLALGALAGEWLRIEGRLTALGDWLQSKVSPAGPLPGDEDAPAAPSLSQGFVAASLVVCVGTMAVLGSLESGTSGNHTILYAKSLLDAIIALVMASTLGVGVLFSAGSVLVYQGLLTGLAVWVSPYLTADMLREMGIVGGILICAIGTNNLGLTRIRAGNMLPALLVPVLWYAVQGLLAL